MDEETASVKQRDSMLVASDVEGYWTDGYTPTPPPLPAHRLPLGWSSENFLTTSFFLENKKERKTRDKT